jgi:hypothetical protein
MSGPEVESSIRATRRMMSKIRVLPMRWVDVSKLAIQRERAQKEVNRVEKEEERIKLTVHPARKSP